MGPGDVPEANDSGTRRTPRKGPSEARAALFGIVDCLGMLSDLCKAIRWRE
jgi:hypothetical protein